MSLYKVAKVESLLVPLEYIIILEQAHIVELYNIYIQQ